MWQQPVAAAGQTCRSHWLWSAVRGSAQWGLHVWPGLPVQGAGPAEKKSALWLEHVVRPSLLLLLTPFTASPLIPSWSSLPPFLPPSLLLASPSSPVSSISRGNANRCPVSKTGIMFLEDVLVILVFAGLLIIASLSSRGEDEEQHRGQQVAISAWLRHVVLRSMQNKILKSQRGHMSVCSVRCSEGINIHRINNHSAQIGSVLGRCNINVIIKSNIISGIGGITKWHSGRSKWERTNRGV